MARKKSSTRWEDHLPTLQLHVLTRGRPAAIKLHCFDSSNFPNESIMDGLNYIHSFHLILTGLVGHLSKKALNLKNQRINRAAHQYMTKFSLGKSNQSTYTMVNERAVR